MGGLGKVIIFCMTQEFYFINKKFMHGQNFKGWKKCYGLAELKDEKMLWVKKI